MRIDISVKIETWVKENLGVVIRSLSIPFLTKGSWHWNGQVTWCGLARFAWVPLRAVCVTAFLRPKGLALHPSIPSGDLCTAYSFPMCSGLIHVPTRCYRGKTNLDTVIEPNGGPWRSHSYLVEWPVQTLSLYWWKTCIPERVKK